jgi:hypothetical protein
VHKVKPSFFGHLCALVINGSSPLQVRSELTVHRAYAASLACTSLRWQAAVLTECTQGAQLRCVPATRCHVQATSPAHPLIPPVLVSPAAIASVTRASFGSGALRRFLDTAAAAAVKVASCILRLAGCHLAAAVACANCILWSRVRRMQGMGRMVDLQVEASKG